jgi:hypothetical protein
VIIRLLRRDVDRAADRVAAEQRALRPAQHLETLDVQHIEQRAHAACEVNAIDVDAHAGFERRREIVLPDSADVHGRDRSRRAVPRIVLDRDVRRVAGNIDEILNPTAFQIGGAERSDRDWRILQRLGALARRHEHFLQYLSVRFHGYGPDRRRRGLDREGLAPGQRQNRAQPANTRQFHGNPVRSRCAVATAPSASVRRAMRRTVGKGARHQNCPRG